MRIIDILENKKEEIKKMRLPSRDRKRDLLDPVSYLKEMPFIAEVKKSSPSEGCINMKADPVETARCYESAGAGCISVLTDEKFFSSSYKYLEMVSEAVALPVLCKDFILSEKQIENAYLHGADFILLIATILDENELKLLSDRARGLGMKVLFEIHYIEEMIKLRDLDIELLGVNARDLVTFEVSPGFAMYTMTKLEGEFLKVAESGIRTPEDVRNFRKSGADAFLIGTSLMRSEDPGRLLKSLYSVL